MRALARVPSAPDLRSVPLKERLMPRHRYFLGGVVPTLNRGVKDAAEPGLLRPGAAGGNAEVGVRLDAAPLGVSADGEENMARTSRRRGVCGSPSAWSF